MSPDLLQPTATPIAMQATACAPASRSATVPLAVAPAAQEQAEPILNPRLRLDPELNMVVIEFLEGVDKVTASIPSARELAAYREQRNAEQPPRAGLDVTR